MLLHGYFDDSGSDAKSPVFVLGGLVSTVDSWKHFSAEWDAKLKQEPSIDYLKMSEANSFTGQFRYGWNPGLRDQKLLELAEIIPKHAMFRADVSMSAQIWRSYLKGTMFTEVVNSPYYFLFYGVLATIGQHNRRLKLIKDDDDLDFIFDEQGGYAEDVLVNWHIIKDASELDAANIGRDMPIFRSDRRFLPLQAADMYAWTLREHIIDPAGKNRTLRVIRRAIGKLDGWRGLIGKEEAMEMGVELMVTRAKLMGLLR